MSALLPALSHHCPHLLRAALLNYLSQRSHPVFLYRTWPLSKVASAVCLPVYWLSTPGRLMTQSPRTVPDTKQVLNKMLRCGQMNLQHKATKPSWGLGEGSIGENPKPQGAHALLTCHSPSPVQLCVWSLPPVTSFTLPLSPHTQGPTRPLKLPQGCPLRLWPEHKGLTSWRKSRDRWAPV